MNNTIRLLSLCFCLTSLLCLSGCWDRVELNDRAIWLATGWDISDDGNIEVTGQIVIPSNMSNQDGATEGSAGGGKTYDIIIQKGENVGEIRAKMQGDLSRTPMLGQRRIFLVSEQFALRGMEPLLDYNFRAPDVSLRTDVMIVKGAKAYDVLTAKSTLENPPAIAAIKKHEQMGGRGDTAFIEFLIAATSKGIAPSLPVVELFLPTPDAKEKKFRMAGVAIFNQDLKLLGFMDVDEDRDLLWIMGKLKKRLITYKDEQGNASINLIKLDSKITPKITSNKEININVKLKGEGEVFENNTMLNIILPKDLKEIERKFEQQTKEHVQQTIEKVQNQFGVDIFGFGEVIHKKSPKEWNRLKDHWHEHFVKAKVNVEVDFKIVRLGLTGPPILDIEREQ